MRRCNGIVTKDMHSYEDFLRETLLSIDLISDVQSRIVLRQSKDTNAIPLNLGIIYLKSLI